MDFELEIPLGDEGEIFWAHGHVNKAEFCKKATQYTLSQDWGWSENDSDYNESEVKHAWWVEVLEGEDPKMPDGGYHFGKWGAEGSIPVTYMYAY